MNEEVIMNFFSQSENTKKSSVDLEKMVKNYIFFQQVDGKVKKALSLAKLGRSAESKSLLQEIENELKSNIKSHPNDFHACLFLALFYIETDNSSSAISILQMIINSFSSSLSNDVLLTIQSELQKLIRAQPVSLEEKKITYTLVHCCYNCGRLINYISVPCIYCEWAPKTIEDLSRSMLICSQYLGIPFMLSFARSVANGKRPNDIIGNIEESAAKFRSNPTNLFIVKDLFENLKKDKDRLSRPLNSIRRCPFCQNQILFCQAENCTKCGKILDLPEIVRLLLCADNLLWFFENRAEIIEADEFTEFICFLVSLVNDILRKQVTPPLVQRQYAISLLSKITAIFDKNKGGVIQTSNPSSLKVFIVEADMLEDTKSYTMFVYNELLFFVKLMSKEIVI